MEPRHKKPAFCMCENKDADQLRSNCAVDQCLCFRYTAITITLPPKSEISSLYPSSVALQSDHVGNPEARFFRDEAQFNLPIGHGLNVG